MKRLLLLFVFIPVFLFSQKDEDVKAFDYSGVYIGKIADVDYEKIEYDTNVKITVTEVGITLESDYSVYKRYAGTHNKFMADRLRPGEFLIDLDDSAYDSDGTMMFIIKETTRFNVDTMENEPIILIAVTIREFNKNTVFTIRGQKAL